MTRVPGKGPPDAKIVFVGEAPGATEVIQGEPFFPTAPAGELFTELTRKAGINREECYITNVVKERVQKIGSNYDGLISFHKNQVDMTEAYKDWEKELYEEISYIKPNLIVPLGNLALWAIARKRGINKWRGSVIESVGSIKCLPTIHPAAALQQGGYRGTSGRTFSPYLYRHYIAMDMHKVAKEQNSGSISRIPRQYFIRPTYSEVLVFIEDCASRSVVYFDIETDSGQISHVSLAYDRYKSMSIPFIWAGKEYFTVSQETEIWYRIGKLLEDSNVRKIVQNGMFDCTFIFRKLGIMPKRVDDTMIAHAVLFPDLHRDLDILTSFYTDIPHYSEEGKAKIQGGYVGDAAFCEYNATDSIVLPEIMSRLKKDLIQSRNSETYDRQVALIEPLIYMQERGMRMDVDALAKTKVETEEKLKTNVEKFRQLCGYDINPASNVQVMEYFYEKKGIKPYVKRTDKGSVPTVDVKALKRLKIKGFEEADILLKIRKDSKLLNTYFEMKLDEDGRIRTFFNPGRTVTGRLSSAKSIFGTGGNVQNLPQDMRQFILPDEGYILFSLDLSQAENRIVAYIAPEPRMIEALENGVDLHCLTAGILLDKNPGDISREPGSSSIGQGEESERHWGKKCNFGLNYGIGVGRGALEFEITMTEFRHLQDRYMAGFPGIPNYWRWVEMQLAEDRTLVNCMGRKRTFLEQWGKNLFDAAYDWNPQSTVGDVINGRGLIHVYFSELHKPTELLNQIHDSIVIQVPISIGWKRIAEILRDIKRSLETPLEWKGREFVIPVDIEMGLNFKKYNKETGENPLGMIKVEPTAKNIEEVYKVWQTPI